MKLVLFVIPVAILISQPASPDEPVARWSFEADDVEAFTPVGGITREEPGPRPPEFPDFDNDNLAIRLDGKSSRLTIADEGANSRFDFTNDDEITIEAWVKLDGPSNSQALYVIGKGRTNSKGVARDNQNWSLRLTTSSDLARLSFLFATAPGPGDSHWHRWTSEAAFGVETGWHHVAVAYRFGDPDSMQGWIDGLATAGKWDLGGITKKPPVTDDDEVWIGSSLGGNRGNSLRGWLDNVAIHRKLLDNTEIASRFKRESGPMVIVPHVPKMPDLGTLPGGRVKITISEAMPSHARWPYSGESWPQEILHWTGDSFLLPRIPLRYDDWGIRSGWKAPLLVRMSADVDLEPGETQFLVRSRALSRLWVDGQLVAQTEPITKDPPNGEEPMIPLPVPLEPGMRLPGYRQQEKIGVTTVKPDTSSRSRVVLELVVGGKSLRAETGEVCVAVKAKDSKNWSVLRPERGTVFPLTDAETEPVLARIESFLAEFDDRNRRLAATSRDEFWNRRHAMAKTWAKQNPAPGVPESNPAIPHPIDAFIHKKIRDADVVAGTADTRAAEQFHNQVLPILRKNCFRCHDQKAKGGLQLSRRDSLLHGGDSDTPAVVPGDPNASEMMVRICHSDPDLRMPPTGSELSSEAVETLNDWIRQGAKWPAPPVTAADLAYSDKTNDAEFLRRIYLDTIGIPPSLSEVESFLANQREGKRSRLIDRLLNDERCADNEMGDWLDLLAENPTLLNKSQGSTGPFRFFLHEALRDNKPFDRMVTELILMRGGAEEGGSAGFKMAAENDAPFAGKAHILASGFLGVELQCARCHDAPFHDVTQRDLFSLAAMLQRKPASVPGTSRVSDAFFKEQQRQPLIRVTLKTGESIVPAWPFEAVTGIADGSEIDNLMQTPSDSRERLATLITAPQNRRFAAVVVNRIWRRLMGAGLVEPVHDWAGQTASHPQLLEWLAHQFVSHNYNSRHIVRLITTSETYQRKPAHSNPATSPERRFFNSTEQRRLTAEQIVDSLYHVVSVPMNLGELTFVHDGRRALSNRQTLGRPTRAWMLASLNNERDRPSLSLPKAQVVADVLEAFGWTGSRQKPISYRNTEPNVLQPGAMANGVLVNNLTRAAYGSVLAQIAVDAKTPDQLVNALFLRILSREPKSAENEAFTNALSDGFASRLVAKEHLTEPEPLPALPVVTWFNHGQSEANTIQQEIERRVRNGPPPDPRLKSEWREVYEDVVWSLINHREFVWMP